MERMQVSLNQILDIRKESLDKLLHLKNDMNVKSRSEFVQRTQERMSVNVTFPYNFTDVGITGTNLGMSDSGHQGHAICSNRCGRTRESGAQNE